MMAASHRGVQARSAAQQPVAMPIGNPTPIKAPLGLPPVPIPADNPPTGGTIALGRRLYYDPLLSVGSTISRASCHAPQFAFSDSRPSVGVGGQLGKRHAPTVKDTLAHYIGGGSWNPYLDKEIHSLDVLTFDERDDLLQFLDALNGKRPDNIGPPADLAAPAKAITSGK